MESPTIGVALICKDELEELQRLLPQLKQLDQVVVCHTGTSIKLRSYVKKLGTPFKLMTFAWRPTPKREDGSDWAPDEWGFAAARQASFDALVTDYALWVDVDDVVVGTVNGQEIVLHAEATAKVLRNLVIKNPEADAWFLDYIYSMNDAGKPNVVFARERLVKRSLGWRWKFPIHEVMIPEAAPEYVICNDVKLAHLPGPKKESSAVRNERYLVAWIEQLLALDQNHPDLGRARLMIGDHYWSLEQYRKCADWLFKEFIGKHPEAAELEIWQSWNLIGKSQLHLLNSAAAEAAYLKCLSMRPDMAAGYYGLAEVKMIMHEDPEKVLQLIDNGARCPDPPTFVMHNPMDFTFTPYMITADCKLQMKQFDEAMKFVNLALALDPGDPRARYLRSEIAFEIRKRDAKEAARALYMLLNDFDENAKAEKLYEVLPYTAQEDEEIQSMAEVAEKRVRHLHSDEEYIKLYVGNEGWHPVPESVITDGKVIWEADRFRYILDRLQREPGIKRVLDVGCSDGFMSLALARLGYEVVGIDLDPRCVQLANERAEKYGLSAGFVHGWFERINPDRMLDPIDDVPFRNHFDAIYCGEVIEHVQDPAWFMGCLSDCAKDGAPIILTTPDGAFDRGEVPFQDIRNARNDGRADHVRVYTQITFEALLKSLPELDVVDSHFLPAMEIYRPNQGWQVGEARRQPRNNGPLIRIFCGSLLETFTPVNLHKGGVGGSETAVIQMAEEWAKLGCQVVVYNGASGVYNGVFYRPVEYFNPEHKSDILVAWRTPWLFKDARPNATTTVLWAHDIHFPAGMISDEMAARVDKVAVLSNWHRNHFAEHHPNVVDKLWVTRNGIDPERFNKQIEKVPYKYYYSSSPMRGLDVLLDVWPQIRERIPTAELHVAYGFDLSYRINDMMGHQRMNEPLRELERRVNRTEGVVHHDRLNQDELANLQLSCEAWLYPPHEFEETYCIGALEAQAAKAAPFIRLNGALPETVQRPIEWKANLDIDYVVAILEGIREKYYEDDLVVNQAWAKTQTWSSLAQEWLLELAPKEESALVKTS